MSMFAMNDERSIQKNGKMHARARRAMITVTTMFGRVVLRISSPHSPSKNIHFRDVAKIRPR